VRNKKNNFFFSFWLPEYFRTGEIAEETGTKKVKTEVSYLPNKSLKIANIALAAKNHLTCLPCYQEVFKP